jgi:NodT family efflux transporter outer membrane factor (OMF) lipoprotein
MIAKLSSLVLCLLFLSACSVTPEIDRSDISSQLPQAFIYAPSDESSATPHWSESFSDPVLIQDIKRLSLQNYEIEAAKARVEQAAASYGISRADLFPSLSVSSSYERNREKEDRGSYKTDNKVSIASALYWEIDIWGRLSAKREASALTASEKIALADEIELDIQTLLVESWITRHTSQKMIAILEDQKDTNLDLLALTEYRLSQGQGNALDVLQARQKLSASNRALPSVRADVVAAENAYDVLLGQSPDGQDIALEIWPDIKPFSSLPSPISLIESRPDLRAAYLTLLANDQEVAAAIADRLPTLSIGLSYEHSGNRLPNTGDNQLLSFTAGILAPVFDAGRRKNEVSRRKAIVMEALAKLEQAMLIAVREIEDGLSRETALFIERQLVTDEITLAQQTVDKSLLRYVNGEDNYLNVLDSLDTLQNLQQDEIQLQRDLLLNRARILNAFGSKWNDT